MFVAPSGVTQWEKSPKNSLKECVFVNSTLKVQCYIVKKKHYHRLIFGDFAH